MNNIQLTPRRRSIFLGGLSFIGAVLLGASAIGAQLSASSTNVTIEHRHEKGQVNVILGSENNSQKREDPIKIKGRPSETISLVISDPNTLLFDYKLGERTEVFTADYAALKEFAKIVAADLEKPAAVKIQAQRGKDTRKLTAGNSTIEVAKIFPALKDLAKAVKDIPEKIDFLARQTELSVEDEKTLRAPLVPIGALLDIFQQITIASLAGTHVQLDDENVTPAQLWDKLPDEHAVYENREAVIAMHHGLAAFLKDYEAYKLAVKKHLTIGTIKPDNEKVITQKVEIGAKPVTGIAEATKTHQKDFSGTYTFEVSPIQSFHFRAGVGVIYSFVTNPEYSVSTQANGTLLVAEKKSDANALSAAGTLNIYPDRYWGEPIEPFVQIGYSPAKDTQGILGGIGFTAYGKVQFAGGIIYQQHRELAGGQTVGAVLVKAEDLRIEKKWAPGLYVQVSIPIPFTK